MSSSPQKRLQWIDRFLCGHHHLRSLPIAVRSMWDVWRLSSFKNLSFRVHTPPPTGLSPRRDSLRNRKAKCLSAVSTRAHVYYRGEKNETKSFLFFLRMEKEGSFRDIRLGKFDFHPDRGHSLFFKATSWIDNSVFAFLKRGLSLLMNFKQTNRAGFRIILIHLQLEIRNQTWKIYTEQL
jgi:hypothetical protein